MFLSFIIPVYNAENYLKECLDSLLYQDIPQDEGRRPPPVYGNFKTRTQHADDNVDTQLLLGPRHPHPHYQGRFRTLRQHQLENHRIRLRPRSGNRKKPHIAEDKGSIGPEKGLWNKTRTPGRKLKEKSFNL